MKGYINANTKIKSDNPVNPEILGKDSIAQYTKEYVNTNIAKLINDNADDIFSRPDTMNAVQFASKANVYSTIEQEVGLWVDGKPLYQKTIILDNPEAFTYYNHNIMDIDMCMVKEINCIRNGSWFTPSYSMFENSGNHDFLENCSCICDKTRLYPFYSKTTINKMYITLQYTKTTD